MNYFALMIPENAPVNTTWTLPGAVDEDAGYNGELNYKVMGGAGPFYIR